MKKATARQTACRKTEIKTSARFAAGVLLVGVLATGLLSSRAEETDQVPAVSAATLYCAPATPLAMALKVERELARGAGILMPDPDHPVRLNGGLIPLDGKSEGFPPGFLSGLTPEKINGVEAWRVTLCADDTTGAMVFYNGEGDAFWTVEADASVYTPDWVARIHSPDGKADVFFDLEDTLAALEKKTFAAKLPEETLYRAAWLAARQYLLPSHVEMAFTFILEEDADTYVAAESETVTLAAVSTQSASDSLTGLAVTGISVGTNGVSLSANWPANSYLTGNALDVFFSGTLSPPAWTNLLRVTVNVATNTLEIAVPRALLPSAPETPPPAYVTNIVQSSYDPGILVTNIICTNAVWVTESGFFQLADLTDTDSDGLTDAMENFVTGTSPELSDTDGDTLDDGWEIKYGLDPFAQDDPSADPDGDGLIYAEECAAGTDPFNGDTDNDGIGDSAELQCFHLSHDNEGWLNTPVWPNLFYKTWSDSERNWKNVILPFPLHVGGHILSNVTINAHGILAFHDSSETNCLDDVYGSNLPLTAQEFQSDTNTPLVIAAFWDSLELADDGTSYVRMAETTTNSARYCVIEYINMKVLTPQYADGGRISFQLRFIEGMTNQISVFYRDASGGYATGRSATLGFRTPSTILQVAYNLIGSVYSGLHLKYFLGPGTDPLDNDTDDDDLHDGIEYSGLLTNPCSVDTDDDGLTDAEEVELGTKPLNSDTDGDGLPDGWESLFNLDPLHPETDTASDSDGDGLSLAQEAEFGTNPNGTDTDNDGLTDDEEVFTVRAGNVSIPWFDVSGGANLFPGTSSTTLNYGNKAMPLPFPFTAGGLTFTQLSANVNGLIGLYGDSGRNLTSSYNVNFNLEENDAVDFDKVSLAIAAFWDDLMLYPTELGSSVIMADVQTNGNRFCVIEYLNAGFTGTGNPSVTNRISFQVVFTENVSNRVTVLFKNAYGKGDGRSATLGAQTARQCAQYSYNTATVSNGLELVYVLGYGTAPLVRDSDGDGVTDGDEAHVRHTDPLVPDSDGDGLTDGWEVSHNTNPLSTDTDGDTLPDGWEASYGWSLSDPDDPFADSDNDGLLNFQEAVLGTNPDSGDSDGDDLGDDEEASFVQITDGGLDSLDVSGGIPLFEAVTVSYLSSGTTNVVLPFPVVFDGLTMTGLSVSLKGVIGLYGDGQSGFESGVGSSNHDLETADLEDYGCGLVVAGLWDNLYVYRASDSAVTLADISTNGQRYCVVDYRNMRVSSTSSNHLASFQIVFTEGFTNRVSVFYRTAQGNGDGRLATLGILSSRHAIQYSYNTNSVVSGLELTYRIGTDTDPLTRDTDGDGLWDRDETLIWHTDPFVADTDGDLWPDGWEAQNYNPVTETFSPLAHDAWDADPDQDGLTNVEEFDNGTTPNNSDTDNDLRSDGEEVANASDPRSAASTAPQASVPVHFLFGDQSPSNSEKYRLKITPLSGDERNEMTRVNHQFGEPEYFDVPLVKGARYRVELEHHSTNLEAGPDCDYTLTVSNALIACSSNESQSGNGIIAPGIFLVAEDPDGLLGTHATDPADTPFAGAGKSVILTLHSIDIVQTNLLGCPHCLPGTVFALTNSYAPGGVVWAVEPHVTGGATISGNGQTAVFQPGTVGTNYTVTATSAAVPACSDTARVTVCVPGPITVLGDEYHTTTSSCFKEIYHLFTPTPLTTASAQHFCFVQYVRGFIRLPDGTYGKVIQYGNQTNILNFTVDVIDSLDDDPAYGNISAHYGHSTDDGERYYVYDFPSPMSAIGSQSDLHFTIGLYCIKGVPMTGASSNPPVGVPFDTKTWGYQISVTTNAIGEKVFIHP